MSDYKKNVRLQTVVLENDSETRENKLRACVQIVLVQCIAKLNK